MFRILHISDLHARATTQWATDTLLKVAAKALLQESADHNFDVIAFTGDIAHSGKSEEYKIAEEWIDSCFLQSSGLNLDPTQLLFVPGNHDVDRKLISPSATAIEEQLRRVKDQNGLAQYYNDQEARSTLFRRHSAYRDFLQRVRSDEVLGLPSWSQAFDTGSGSESIVFEGYNTSWLCRGPDDHGRLLIGQPQLTERFVERPDHRGLTIALMHHPLTDLAEFDQRNVEMHLRDQHDLLLRGHLHDPDAVHKRTRNGEYLEFAAGALYESHSYPNSFSIIDIADDLRSLTVKPFVWQAPRWIVDRNLYPDAPEGIATFPLSPRSAAKKKR